MICADSFPGVKEPGAVFRQDPPDLTTVAPPVGRIKGVRIGGDGANGQPAIKHLLPDMSRPPCMKLAGGNHDRLNAALNQTGADRGGFRDCIVDFLCADGDDVGFRDPIQIENPNIIFIPGATGLKACGFESSQGFSLAIPVDDDLGGQILAVKGGGLKQTRRVFRACLQHHNGIGGKGFFAMHNKTANHCKNIKIAQNNYYHARPCQH